MSTHGTRVGRLGRRCIGIIGILAAMSMYAEAQQVVTWTLDADFDKGLLINVNHDVVSDQLQLNHESALLPFVNVAASDRGTVIRIDANTGDIIGEYRTTPQGTTHNPSRTTVDRAGNVWAANRDIPRFPTIGEGSVVKFGVVLGGTRCDQNGLPNPNGSYLKPPYLYCTAVDRDGDGLIRTSRGLGDIHPWVGADVDGAQDECVLIYKNDVPARNCRHISVDADNNVWVGGYSLRSILTSTMMKLNGQTGEVMQLHEGLDCGGYGGLVSANGTIFSSSLNGGGGPLLMMTPAGTATCLEDVHGYGLAEDPDGNIWATTYQTARLYKLSPTGVVLPGFPINLNGTQVRGLAVTPDDGHVWIACTGTNTLEHRDENGILIKEFALDQHAFPGEFPTGVAVDYNGKVWVTNADSDNVFRIDPNGDGGKGRIDLVVDLGAGARPYNYSDMTGAAYGEYFPLYGIWSMLHDGLQKDMVWQRVSWTSDEPGDSEIRVKARAANSRAELLDEEFEYLPNAVLNCDSALSGRYIQIFVEFLRGSSVSNNPVLYDVEVAGTERPAIVHTSDVICSGDSVRIQADPRFTQIRWSDGKGGAVRYITTGGLYWYSGKTPLGCYISSDTILVEEHQKPQPLLDASATRKCADEEVVISVRSPYRSYRWEPGLPSDTTRSIRVTMPGVYRATVVDSNGCTGLSPPVVIENYPVPSLQLAALGDTVLCGDGADVTLRATPGFAEYFWSTNDSGFSNSLTVSDSGTYTVWARDSNGCRAFSNPVHIRHAPRALLELTLEGPASRCAGDSVFLHATPGFVEYRWSTGAQGGMSDIPGGDSGLYWVEAIDSNGCHVMSDTIALTVHPAPVLTLQVQGDSVHCGPGTVRLEATPGYEEYAWSHGVLTALPWIEVNNTGTFFVQVTDSNGCPGTSNPVRIVFEEAPVVDLWLDGGSVLCRGSISMLNATPGYLNYRWSTGESGPMMSIVIADSGRYWVEVENEAGCKTYSDTIVVTIGDELRPQVIADSDTICAGGSATLDAGGGFARYNWSTGDTTRATTVTRAGQYSVTVFAENGCTGDTTVTVYEEVLPAITGAQDTLCRGDTHTLDAGEGYAAYQWSTGEQTRTIDVTGSGTYRVTVTTARGCVLNDTVTVYSFPLRPLVFEGPLRVCPGTEVRYVIGGDSLSSVDWTLSSGGTIRSGSSEREIVVRWLESGTHSLDMHAVLFPSACPYDSSLRVVVEDVIAPPIEGDPRICEGASTRLYVSAHAGSATWVFPDGSRMEMVDTVSSTQTGLHRFITANTTGCADTTSVVVTALPAPDARIVGRTVFCDGEESALRAEGNYASHRWVTESGVDLSDTLRRGSAGQVVLETMSPDGCVARDTVQLSVLPLVQPFITGDSILIPGDSLLLCLQSAWASVRWHFPGGATVDDVLCVTARDTGMYIAEVIDTAGCSAITRHRVRASDVVAAAVITLPDMEAEPGERVTIPLRMLSSANLEQLPLTNWQAELHVDARVLYPAGSTPEGTVVGDTRIIPLREAYIPAAQVLAGLDFLVLLGPVDRCPLHLASFTWEGGEVRTETRDGALRVLVCTEGGDRLYDAQGTLRLEANRPNPFNNSTVITFELIERGPTEVSVLDQLGRHVQTLQSGILQPGVYSLLFDGSGRASGQYFCVLRTPSQLRIQRMQLIK